RLRNARALRESAGVEQARAIAGQCGQDDGGVVGEFADAKHLTIREVLLSGTILVRIQSVRKPEKVPFAILRRLPGARISDQNRDPCQEPPIVPAVESSTQSS